MERLDFLDSLNSFTFLNATRAISVEDFVEKIDKKTISNNVMVVCAKELKTEINAILKEKQSRNNKVVASIIVFDFNVNE